MDTGRKAQYHGYIYTNTIYISILPKSTFTFYEQMCVCVCLYSEDLILRFHDS